MLRQKSSPCLFCAFKATTQQTASVHTKLAPRPNRFSLAKARTVNTPEPSSGEAGRPNRRRQDGPFGGMNQREAKIRGVPERANAQRDKKGRPGRREDPRADGFRALKMQRSLTAVSYDQRTRIKDRMREIETFDQFPLIQTIKSSISTQALQGMEDLSPTPVQKIAIPALLGSETTGRRSKSAVKEHGEFLIAAETGSGKTLAYLIPTMNAVKEAEAQDEDIKEYEQALEDEKLQQAMGKSIAPPISDRPHPTTGRPRVIILVPTSELVAQVGGLVKSFSHTVSTLR